MMLDDELYIGYCDWAPVAAFSTEWDALRGMVFHSERECPYGEVIDAWVSTPNGWVAGRHNVEME